MPQVEVTFDIDANGIVNVSAKDKGTGKEQQIRIQASGGLSDTDIEKMVKDAEAHAEEDKKRKAQVEAKNHAEALIHSTEKSLAEHGDKVGEPERRAIEDALAALKEAVKGDNAEDDQGQDQCAGAGLDEARRGDVRRRAEERGGGPGGPGAPGGAAARRRAEGRRGRRGVHRGRRRQEEQEVGLIAAELAHGRHIADMVRSLGPTEGS